MFIEKSDSTVREIEIFQIFHAEQAKIILEASGKKFWGTTTHPDNNSSGAMSQKNPQRNKK